jgi:colanic acid biosynthesis glycosyl transferase WcaI
VAVIPNWAETDDLQPKPRTENELLKELNVSDKFVVLYAGNMGHPNDVESVVECAQSLRDDERFHFIFLGTGAKRKWLEEEVKNRDTSNITLLPPRPRMEQNAFLNACDIAVITLVPGMWGVSMPSRTYNTLAVGKPVIAMADPGSELALVVEEDNIGWVVPPGKPERLKETIFLAYEKWADFDGFREKSRNAALKKYTLQMAMDKYQRELNDCI